jgi:hypothetical protein
VYEGQVGGFPPSIPVSSTNKSDRHDIIEIYLRVALNTITLTLNGIHDIFFIFLLKESLEYFSTSLVSISIGDCWFPLHVG